MGSRKAASPQLSTTPCPCPTLLVPKAAGDQVADQAALLLGWEVLEQEGSKLTAANGGDVGLDVRGGRGGRVKEPH